MPHVLSGTARRIADRTGGMPFSRIEPPTPEPFRSKPHFPFLLRTSSAELIRSDEDRRGNDIAHHTCRRCLLRLCGPAFVHLLDKGGSLASKHHLIWIDGVMSQLQVVRVSSWHRGSRSVTARPKRPSIRRPREMTID